MKTDIRSMNLNELTEFLSQLNQPKFRAAQIFKWLQSGVETFDQMTNIPKPLREVLAEKCYADNDDIAAGKYEEQISRLIEGYEEVYVWDNRTLSKQS